MASSSVRQLFILLALDVYHSFTSAQESTTLSYSIREEQMNNTFVGNVARDSLLYGNVTQEEFNLMRFQILTQGNQHAWLFHINTTSSSLYTNGVLDRESLCLYMKSCLLNFNVAVYKLDPTNDLLDLFKIIQINVSLEDTNDNAPIFPNSEISLSVEESVSVGYVIYTSAADDKDTGFNNSVQTYELVPGNEMFGLDITKHLDGSSDLGLVVNYNLDRETNDFYQLKIFARDGGFPQRTGTLTINITVTDFNDNRPLFSMPTYEVKIPENQAVKSPILSLSATDADIGENGEFYFRFNSRVLSKITDIFEIDTTSGEINLKSSLDYEEETQYKFLVEVVDNGRIPLSSSAMVTVDVVDINDNAPQINTNFPPKGTLITESAEIGRYVATVSVSDNDLGPNGKVLCQILGDSFDLEELYTNMYKIVVGKKLDYEAQKSHNITVMCQDQGIPQQQNSSMFTVYVKDENDNPPVFLKNLYRATIPENLLTFQEIVHVSATDKDSDQNGKVTYFLHTDAGNNFTIDSETGIIMTNAVFDREEDSEVRFHVNATDNGTNSLVTSTLVILSLEDVNDNPPTFTQPHFILNALEGQENEPVVATLTANDLDAGVNGQFTFSFELPIPSEFFLDPQTGVIKCGKLDREVKSQYNFTVRVTDKGNPVLSSTTHVTVNVYDDNDNPPVIHMPNNFNYTFYVPYTAIPGTVILKVNATDPDIGQNSQLRYFIDSISPSNKNLFKLDINTGVFTVAKTMHLYDSDKYRILISVKDNGYSQQVTYQSLDIVVTLTNETNLIVQKDSDEGGTNIVIVVVIIVVTIVLSAAIIITICVIQRLHLGIRFNRSNRKDKHVEKIYNSNHNETISTESSQFSDAPLKKKNKKEVSFSLSDESDSVNASTFTNITSFTTMKHPSGLISLDGKLLDNPQACSSLITNNTLNSEKGKDSYDDKQYQIDCLAYQPDLRPQSPGYWYQQLKEQEAREMDMLRNKNDDTHSETSAESATSDSGRGGSEEDINSNRGHPLSDTDEPYKLGNHSSKNSSILHSSFDTPVKSKQTNDYQRNISFSDDSVTANTSVDELKSKYAKRKEALVAAYMNTHLPNFSQSGISAIHSPHRSNCYPGRAHLDALEENSQSAYGLRYSIQDIDTMSDSVATRDDDGASTTTSGSYTINPDELVNEIDNLFFNSDVIV